MDPEDQIWLGRFARQWASDPANGFCDPSKLNAMDRQLFGLFDSIEAGAGDIDEQLEALHQRWDHGIGFLQKTMYRLKLHYLYRAVSYEASQRAGTLKTPSANQTLANWNRFQLVYNGYDGSFRPAKAWVGPQTGPLGPTSLSAASAKEGKSGGRYIKGQGYFMADGARMEGPLVDIAFGIGRLYQNWRAKRAVVVEGMGPSLEDSISQL
jgi:hypothetical protein